MFSLSGIKCLVLAQEAALVSQGIGFRAARIIACRFLFRNIESTGKTFPRGSLETKDMKSSHLQCRTHQCFPGPGFLPQTEKQNRTTAHAGNQQILWQCCAPQVLHASKFFLPERKSIALQGAVTWVGPSGRNVSTLQ